MNELIKQCFIRADGSIEIDEVTRDEWTYTENLDVEKFARLIIQECVDACENIGRFGDGQNCSDIIQKRFQ